MIKFGMNNTILIFRGQFYEYGGNGGRDDHDRCLTTGGHKSTWIANLVAAFIIERTRTFFKEEKIFGIYKDYGLVFHDSILTKDEIKKWLDKFQKKADKICGNKGLIVTANMWQPTNRNNKQIEKISPTVSIKY